MNELRRKASIRGDVLAIVIVVLLIVIIVGGYFYYVVSRDLKTTQESLASTTASYQKLQADLAGAEQENASATDALSAEQARNDSFESQIDSIQNTVGQLDKLSKTDPELLKKYSKVYFLNENYVPASLTNIPSEYASAPDKNLQILTQVWPHLKDLLEDASSSGDALEIASAYRSFGTQASLKESYMVTYGTGANAFSADQGYSEHQLGTTVDFTTQSLDGGLDGFDQTPQYQWLLDNAYKYGFILSYPEDNSYYEFEPWHWRFVGIDLATMLHKNHENFYDLDQRTIDSYLISFFDN